MLIRQEERSFSKKLIKPEEFQNVGFSFFVMVDDKLWLHYNHVISLTEFSSNANRK